MERWRTISIDGSCDDVDDGIAVGCGERSIVALTGPHSVFKVCYLTHKVNPGGLGGTEQCLSRFIGD
jgi:hypothetical protein